MTEEKEYIGFYINSDLKKEFQKLCIDRDTDVTTMLKDFIEISVKEHLSIKPIKRTSNILNHENL